jgi:hypothetical protein
VGIVNGGWDELTARAQEAAESGGTPDSWGDRIDIPVGGVFRGRYRGHDDGGRSGAHLLWDEDGRECFVYGKVSLDREMEREQPGIGYRVVISRGENYKSQYDEDGEATGLNYGVAAEASDEPVPGDELAY